MKILIPWVGEHGPIYQWQSQLGVYASERRKWLLPAWNSQSILGKTLKNILDLLAEIIDSLFFLVREKSERIQKGYLV